ncbi:MAG: hypothetical protein ACTSPY_09195 [Candidatus Helarchaeota archaeon]
MNLLPINPFKITKLKYVKGSVVKLVNNIPDILKIPMIKSSQGEINAIKSGIRSAIYRDKKTGNFYRIKGCGVNDDGFIYEYFNIYVNEHNTIKKKRLRGCQFQKTCLRELEITKKLGNIFKKKHLFFPNHPIGYWIYETKFQEVPYASLYKTYGELRLNDDILYYLEQKLFQNINFYSELLRLYYKFGLQIGYIKKTMEDAEYLWGTFLDMNDKIFHSNAHINNIIVARINNQITLGPLDFDLAYYPGELTTKEFEHKKFDEMQVLEASIKGWQTFTPQFRIFWHNNNQDFEKCRNNLRNNMYNGFLQGFEGPTEIISFKEIEKFF